MVICFSEIDFCDFNLSLELSAEEFPFFVEANACRVVRLVEVDKEGLS
jgi:hypothetical protein